MLDELAIEILQTQGKMFGNFYQFRGALVTRALEIKGRDGFENTLSKAQITETARTIWKLYKKGKLLMPYLTVTVDISRLSGAAETELDLTPIYTMRNVLESFGTNWNVSLTFGPIKP